MRKKMLSMIIAGFMAVSLAACAPASAPAAADQSSSEAEAQTEEKSDEAAEAVAEETAVEENAAEAVDLGPAVTIKMDNGLQPEAILNKCAEEVCARVAERSDGNITIVNYPADQLGNGGERAAAFVAGDLDITFNASSAFDSYNPKGTVLNAFFMFKDWDHYVKMTESPIYDDIISALEESINGHYLGYVYYATRNTISTREIKSVEDMAGLKFRVPNEPMPIEAVTAIGAAATPMPISEVYTSLQNGTVEATENGAMELTTRAFEEVAPYFAYTRHQIQTFNWLMSNNCYDRLTPAQYELIQEVITEVADEYNQISQDAEKEKEEYLKSKITVNEVDTAAFMEAVESTYDSHDDDWGDGTWEAIRALAD